MIIKQSETSRLMNSIRQQVIIGIINGLYADGLLALLWLRLRKDIFYIRRNAAIDKELTFGDVKVWINPLRFKCRILRRLSILLIISELPLILELSTYYESKLRFFY